VTGAESCGDPDDRQGGRDWGSTCRGGLRPYSRDISHNGRGVKIGTMNTSTNRQLPKQGNSSVNRTAKQGSRETCPARGGEGAKLSANDFAEVIGHGRIIPPRHQATIGCSIESHEVSVVVLVACCCITGGTAPAHSNGKSLGLTGAQPAAPMATTWAPGLLWPERCLDSTRSRGMS
jgi:hypothetical protein